MWRRVDVVLTDVSEERIASIFRVEGKIRKSASEETVRAGASTLMSFIFLFFLLP
jgi:predicted transcriptional regulator